MGNLCLAQKKQRKTSHSRLLHEPNNRVNELIVHHGSLENILGKPFSIFNKYVKVFQLYFVATSSAPDDKLLHGAHILQQYFDNDGDGIPDNIAVYEALVKKKATMVMFKNEEEKNLHADFFIKAYFYVGFVQDLQADETRPGSLKPHLFDESLEECFHFITYGYQTVYPDIFGAVQGTAIARAMDKARGGHFERVPKKYPEGAWFTYYNVDCDYFSQICEYMYWAMTSILGAQQYRREQIQNEWKLPTKDEVRKVDRDVFDLLTNVKFKFPTRLPAPAKKCDVP